MSSNLKYKIEIESDVEEIRKYLLEYSAYAKISALSIVNEDLIDALLDEIKICAYDYRPFVRVYAYKALMHTTSDKITEVLKDALRDEDQDAFKAARELFNEMKSKAA